MNRAKTAFLLLALQMTAVLPARAADALLDAMTAELERSAAGLKNAEQVPLYYLGYEISDRTSYGVSAVEGRTYNEDDSRVRLLDADVRVGSSSLDNTHEIKGRSDYGNSRNQQYFGLPLEDDPAPLRQELWNLTDAAYKAALDKYAGVKANKSVTAEEEDKSDDFSKAPPESFTERMPFPEVDKAGFRAMVRRLSEKFKPHDFIYFSYVAFNVVNENKYLANSEGSRIVSGNNYLRFSYSLDTRTKDGMDLNRGRFYDADEVGGLPDEASVSRDIDASIAELKALREAPPASPYSGPVLIQARAAGVFFHEILGHRLEGHRQKSESSGQTFAKKVGEPIMPAFISVYDDPSLRAYGTQFLRGHYRFDDEAVRSRRTPLVENGVLKGFLMGRSPIRDFPASNGHGRRSSGRGAVARMGNLIAASSNAVPYPELRRRFIEEIKKSGKPYGLLVTDISGGYTITERSLPQSFSVGVTMGYKVYPDGRPDEAVRGLNLIGTPLQTFSRILLTGDDYGVFNGDCGAESGWVPVSAVAPSLLFSEMETEKVKKAGAQPPVLKPPFTDR